MKTKLNILVQEANAGDRKALETVVFRIKDLVYNLSLKMLLLPEDAEDATQEILIKVITHLSTFKGDSAFTTWVYRLATNYLITTKQKQSKVYQMSFDAYGDLIDSGHSPVVRYTQNLGELQVLEEEVKVSCTHGVLLCLQETNRMVYILGDILEFTSVEGAAILEITPENFRQQLSRSRTKIRNFLTAKCGLVNPNNPCRCHKKIDFLIDKKMINPKALQFAKHTERSLDVFQKLDTLEKTTAIYRTVAPVKVPEKVMNEVRSILYAIK